ncbi:MAG TPA: lasso peptide biosynthesis B2 protein [Vicinamibacterales bacterium]|nr:lasso peptide biosynthesis B2 protein [Vicinamibacterales bacterium]
MTRVTCVCLVLRALYELLRYDIVHALCGFGPLQRALAGEFVPTRTLDAEEEEALCDAVLTATCLYWKPVMCLQRSYCTLRLFRSLGGDARMVIGYRPVPFFAHAWVEVDGRVVNDSPAYQARLHVLHTIK